MIKKQTKKREVTADVPTIKKRNVKKLRRKAGCVLWRIHQKLTILVSKITLCNINSSFISHSTVMSSGYL